MGLFLNNKLIFKFFVLSSNMVNIKYDFIL